jgi:hypothetical protein
MHWVIDLTYPAAVAISPAVADLFRISDMNSSLVIAGSKKKSRG